MTSFSVIRNLAMLIIATVFTACVFEFKPENLQPEESPRPIVLAVAYDISKSTLKTVPELTPRIVDTLLSLVRHRSGEFGFSCIGEDTPRLTHLRFMPETGNARERERRVQFNDQQQRHVRKEIYNNIKERSDEHTRLFDTIEFLLAFLHEPHLPAEADRYLVVISDFDDDVRSTEQRQPIQIPENITVLVLGADESTINKVLTGPNVIPYTSFDGIIHYLNQEKKNEQ